MKRPNILKQIKKVISDANQGEIFVPADFFYITEPAKVGMCFKRMCECGELTRVMRRIYAKPGYVSLNIDKITQAIARSYGWNVYPCGETALYMTGINESAPDEWTYVSDGRYQTYIYNNCKISFTHTKKINGFANASMESVLLIQALRAIGKNNVNNEKIEIFAKKITKNAIPKILNDANKSASWIKKYISTICDKAILLSSCSDSGNIVIYEDDLKFKTLLGHKVRSKSEAIIAYSLNMAGLKYVYEKPLYDKNKNYYVPDFTVYYRGNEYYWEHLGKLDDGNYALEWYKKEKWYNANFPGKLITTIDYNNYKDLKENQDIGSQINKILFDAFAYGSG